MPGGSLSEGAPADLTLLAPDLPVTVDAKAMKSKSKNTPFDGWELRGGVAATIVAGRRSTRTRGRHGDRRWAIGDGQSSVGNSDNCVRLPRLAISVPATAAGVRSRRSRSPADPSASSGTARPSSPLGNRRSASTGHARMARPPRGIGCRWPATGRRSAGTRGSTAARSGASTATGPTFDGAPVPSVGHRSAQKRMQHRTVSSP